MTTKRKKRRKKTDRMTPAQMREMLGIRKEPKPRVNRKKYAQEIDQRWRKNRMNAFEFEHYFGVMITYFLGRISARAESKPDLLESHRITDEEMGILQLIERALNLHELRDQIKNGLHEYNIMNGDPIDHDPFDVLERKIEKVTAGLEGVSV
ncbi:MULTISPECIES: hypothetical protein [Brevibacillus]|uniref:hypothetical protein n=1 Tax=Brevibacillus TaxID=55080 RepID=UPI000D0FB1E4|nr:MULTISPECIES: hypothetical protein [Brevibacillus]PSJ66951.1 hypothetical protein C7J99_22985 [Brevibacillus brevis]RED27771.1 hypothetical protein DES34_10963 [Brevibacillus brevis]TQK42137.1 hypothetical protein FB479_115129 [Brevibacillus sp. AG162]VEF86808.1 Uncharacterised protein [Brevibacillus brevis]GEC88611.1 hypothetical protein BBR01nite_09420 [Brevibacillus brevis]